jgi:prophage antirepressor-like protein
VIAEKGIYRLIMRSRRKEAEEFQDWVFETLKEMRQATGLEGFQVFRMLDKEHQKDAMKKLRDSLRKPVRVDFIKANTIANKAVSSKYGHPMLIKKDQMTPNMLVDRQGVLDDTVDLMDANERFNLGLSVSEKIYEKHVH